MEHMFGYFQYSKRPKMEGGKKKGEEKDDKEQPPPQELEAAASLLAPEFLEKIQSRVDTKEGDTVRFTVRVTGKPLPTVTWFREGSKIISSPDFEIIQEGNSHSLYIPEVFYEDSGKFTVTAENPAGQVSCTAELIVEGPSVPEEAISPVSIPPPQFTKPLRDVFAKPGEQVILECNVAPQPEPERVQWFRNEVEIKSSPDYQLKYHQGICTLIIAEVFPEDSGRFTCTVTIHGISNSTHMTLTVEGPPPPPPAPPMPTVPEQRPVFSTELQNQPITLGGRAHFECQIRGHPPPEILWTRRGHPLVDKNRHQSTYDQYTGTTTLTILNVNNDDEGEYTCTAINSVGEASTTAILMGPDRYADWLKQQQDDKDREGLKRHQADMMSELSAHLDRPKQPKRGEQFYRPMTERMVELSAEARLSDFEDPTTEETFKVSNFEKRLMKEVAFREGKIDPQFATSDTEAFDQSFPMGQAQVPAFEQKLKNFQLMEGSDATFVCKVHGSPRPQIQWFHNGRHLRPSNRYIMKLTKDGYASLRIRVAFPEDAGYYTVCATNLVGRETCSAELYVEGLGKIDDTSYVAPDTLRKMLRGPSDSRPREVGGVSEKYFKPIFRKVPQDQQVQEGHMVRFDCIVTGRPQPELFWYRDGVQVHDDNLHKIVVNEDGINSLIIHATHKSDDGLYTCIARNKGGEDQFQVRLNIIAKAMAEYPRFISRLANQTVKEGQAVEFSAEATGVPNPMISWQKDQRMISPEERNYRIETVGGRSTLYVTAAQVNDNCWFQCTAANIAGTASTRARLTVTVDIKKEPERKLVIPKKTPSAPTRPAPAAAPPADLPDRGRVVSPTPDAGPLSPAEPIAPWRVPGAARAPPPVPMDIDLDEMLREAQAPPPILDRDSALAPPGIPKPYDPQKSQILAAIKDHESPHVPADVTMELGSPSERPSTQELIKQGLEPEPEAEDLFSKETPKPPRFKTQIRPQVSLVESQPAHFECRLVPIGDPDMKVEWYKDGKLLRAGHRFRPINDFGYVALDILWTYPEDNGVYMVKATNKYGEDSTQADLKCRGKRSVITDTQLPEGSQSVQQIQDLEEMWRRDRIPKERPEEVTEPAPPLFDLMPEACQVEEGDTAKFMVKVSGHPRPRLTWWINGAMIVSGNRFRLRYDGMIHILEIPKAREYDNGTIRVVAKNPLGEAECSTTLVVIAREDWRNRLKQAPKSTVAVELDKKRPVELRSFELDRALKKSKTTVVELRAFERSSQSKAQAYKDEEVKQAFKTINLRHAQMKSGTSALELRALEPMLVTDTDVHRERAKYMLGLMEGERRQEEAPRIPRVKFDQQAPPQFSGAIKPVRVKEGEGAKFEVNFVGHPPPKVQWFREGFEIQPTRDFQITNTATKSVLFIPEVFPEDSGMFNVKLSNPFGMTEAKASLHVTEEKEAQKEAPPEFRVQMRDITIAIGEPATFDCQVSGYPRPEVYWTKDGKRMSDSKRWKFIVEEDHFTLLIYEVTKSDSGLYECVVVNKMGKATCSARLSANGSTKSAPQPFTASAQKAPELTEPLKDQRVDEGSSATFRCRIAAKPEPVVQWYYNNQVIKPSKYFQMKSTLGIHTLTIAGAFPEDEGTYKCTARNIAGEVTSIAHLKVNALSSEAEIDKMELPKFTKPISGLDTVDGQAAHFDAVVSGTPPPRVTWYREGHLIQHSDEFQISMDKNKHSLLIKSTMPEDSGIFTCRATNPAGVAECSAELFVEDVTRVSTGAVTLKQAAPAPQKPVPTMPEILKAPSPIRDVIAGSTTKLVVQIAAFPPPRFTWFVNGKQIRPSQRFKVSYENGIITLVIFNLQPADSGDYLLKCTNDLGEVTCKTTLNIKPTEKLVQLPTGTTEVTISSKMKPEDRQEVTPAFLQPLPPEMRVKEKGVARLECQVQAVPAPKVSWHVNGIEIKPSPKYTISLQGNKSILQIKQVAQQDTGVYTCKAMSSIGEAVTSTTLYVVGVEPLQEPPKFIVNLQNREAIDGEEVVLTCTAVGNPPPELSWFHNDKNIDKSEDFVITYDRSTGRCDLMIVECLPDDQGTFRCVAQNPAGQAFTKCTLTVHPPPQPVPMEVEQITVDVVDKAQAAPPPPVVEVEIQQPRQRGSRGSVRGSLDKTVVEVTRKSSDIVREEGLEKETTKIVTKKVVKKYSGEPPRFTQPIEPQVVREGEKCVFEAVISGAPAPDITWLKDKKDLTPSDRVVAEYSPDTNTCRLVIHNAIPSDVGVYSCRISNTAGKATCTANIVVVPPGAQVTVTEKTTSVKKEKVTVVGESETRVVETSPQFSQALPPKVVCEEGQNATLECLLSADPLPNVAWYKSGIEMMPTQRIEIMFDNGLSRLTILGATSEDSGEYICRAVNILGESSTRTILQVGDKEREVTMTLIPQEPGMPADAPISNGNVPADAQRAPTLEGPAPEVPPAPLTEPCAVIAGQVQEESPRFTMPLRDQTVNDGEQAVFKVFFRGYPTPSITWFFNSRPIKPSKDFKINVNVQQGKSELVIVEVFPEDEGEYTCRAENRLGTAVTHCHLFVRLPSSSDEETEKVISKTIKVVRTEEPITIQQRSKFTEHIAIDHKGKPKSMELQFKLPEQQRQKAEIQLSQRAVPKGMKMEVEVPQQTVVTQTKALELKKKAEALVTQRQEVLLHLQHQEKKHFVETVAIDHAAKPKEVEMQFKVPSTKPERKISAIEMKQSGALKGMKMEVEIARPKQTSRMDIQQTRRVEATETQRQELQLMLGGDAPKFVVELVPLKVMDGEEVRFRCVVVGNPMPDIIWFHDDKKIVDNPDFRTCYEIQSGTCTLLILEVFPQDTGMYRCIATNQFGKATTQAHLQVDVYEYVPDSEEATTSQTESLRSDGERHPISEDEIEFIERTEAFLANMRELRQEMGEEEEEEIVELTEEVTEETVQMADVTWQMPQQATTTEEQVEVGKMEEFGVELESMSESEIKVEYATPEVRGRRISHVEPVVGREIEETEDLIGEASMDTQKEEYVVDLQQVEGIELTESRVGIVEERLSEGSAAEIGDITFEETIEEEIPSSLAQTPPSEEVFPSHVSAQVHTLTEETLADLQERMPSPEVTESQDIQVEFGEPSVESAPGAFVDLVHEHHSEEEEDEMFYDAPEPGIAGETVPSELALSEKRQKPATQVVTQEVLQDIELAQEAQTEFIEEEPSLEEIPATAVTATKAQRKLSHVSMQKTVLEAQTATDYEAEQVTEETTDGQEVQYQLDVAAREEAKPSRVGHVEEQTEIHATDEDILELTEEFTQHEEVPSQAVLADKRDRPVTEVGMSEEGVRPELVSEEFVNSIKEVYMIPSIVRPEYEPSVVERYRFETRVRPQTGETERQEEAETSTVVQKEQVTPRSTVVVLEKAEVEPTKEVRQRTEVIEEQTVDFETVVEEVEIVKPPPPMEAPGFEMPLSDLTVNDGEKAIFTARVTGVPKPTVVWYVDNQEVKPSADFQITYEDNLATFIIMDVLPEDDGEYMVKAVNEAGYCVSTAYLTVLPPSRPDSDVQFVPGETEEPLIFPEPDPNAELAPPKPIQEEFYKMEVDIRAETKKEVAEAKVSLPANEAPRFTKKLVHREIFETMPVTLECFAVGHPEPTITWYQDGKKITASHHMWIDYQKGLCTLTLDKVTVEDEAEYMCEARNEAGVATTAAELLVEKLVSAVEQVIMEEFYEITIEMFFKWQAALEGSRAIAQ